MSLAKQLIRIEERIHRIFPQESAVMFRVRMQDNNGKYVDVTGGIAAPKTLIRMSLPDSPQNKFTVNLNTIKMTPSGSSSNFSQFFSDSRGAVIRSVEITVDPGKKEWSFVCGGSGVLKASYSNLKYLPCSVWDVHSYYGGGNVESVDIFVNGSDTLLFQPL